MARTKLSFKISKNFWNYYLVKWKIKKKAILLLNTFPDCLSLQIDQNFLRYNKNLLKALFNFVYKKILEYYKTDNRIVIFSDDKKFRKECSRDEIFYLETIKSLLDSGKNFSSYDKDFFLVDIDKEIKFLIRKNNVSDIGNLLENFIGGQYSFIYPYLKDGIVLDIGSYIADTTILFYQKGAKKVYAYEAHPLLYEICKKNIFLNKLEKYIEVFNYGIGDEEKEVKIREDSLIGPTSSFALEEREGAQEIKLKIKPFYKILEGLDRVDVLKMDCEGAEFCAILSCDSNLLKKIKTMAIEYHREPTAIIRYLTDIGFKVKVEREYSRERGLIFAIFKN